MNDYIKDIQAGSSGTNRKIMQKTATDFTRGDNGKISGYFSIFATPKGNGVYEGKVDSYGDIVDPHCFDKTIRERKASGKPWPLLYNHDFNQILGRVTNIKTDSKGAFFTAEFFPTERAQEIRAICAANTLFQFSWAYDVVRQAKVRLTDGTTANCLQEVNLYEITITGTPAETRAQMTDIKQAEGARSAEADRLLSYIGNLDAEQRYTKWELLRTINQMQSQDRAAKLKKLKAMEERAIADIAIAEKRNDQVWKMQRVSALEAIRAQISALKRAKG